MVRNVSDRAKILQMLIPPAFFFLRKNTSQHHCIVVYWLKQKRFTNPRFERSQVNSNGDLGEEVAKVGKTLYEAV